MHHSETPFDPSELQNQKHTGDNVEPEEKFDSAPGQTSVESNLSPGHPTFVRPFGNGTPMIEHLMDSHAPEDIKALSGHLEVGKKPTI